MLLNVNLLLKGGISLIIEISLSDSWTTAACISRPRVVTCLPIIY